MTPSACVEALLLRHWPAVAASSSSCPPRPTFRRRHRRQRNFNKLPGMMTRRPEASASFCACMLLPANGRPNTATLMRDGKLAASGGAEAQTCRSGPTPYARCAHPASAGAGESVSSDTRCRRHLLRQGLGRKVQHIPIG